MESHDLISIDLLIVVVMLVVGLFAIRFVDAAGTAASRCAMLAAIAALTFALVERRHHPT